MSASLYAALAELVACKDLKDELDRLDEANTACTDAQQLHYNVLKSDYQKRKPAAWAAARSVLQTAGWVLAKQGPPDEDRTLVMLVGDGSALIGYFSKRFGGYGDGGAYVRAVKGKKYTEIIVVDAVVAWSYVQLPLPELFS